MNEYEVFLKLRADREAAARKGRNARFAAEALHAENDQPSRLRFLLRLRIPRFVGLREGRRADDRLPAQELVQDCADA